MKFLFDELECYLDEFQEQKKYPNEFGILLNQVKHIKKQSNKITLGNIDYMQDVDPELKPVYFRLPFDIVYFEFTTRQKNGVFDFLAVCSEQVNKRGEAIITIAFAQVQNSVISLCARLRRYDFLNNEIKNIRLYKTEDDTDYDRAGGSAEWLVYHVVKNACLFLSTKQATLEQAKANRHQKKAYARVGDSYKVIKINGKQIKHSIVRSESYKKNGSVRAHWRMAHWRNLANGDVTWVRACLVGDKKTGMLKKDYNVII